MTLPDPPQSFDELKAEMAVRDKAFAFEMKALKRRLWWQVSVPSLAACVGLGVLGLAMGVPGPLSVLMQLSGAHVVMQVAKRRLERREALAERSES